MAENCRARVTQALVFHPNWRMFSIHSMFPFGVVLKISLEHLLGEARHGKQQVCTFPGHAWEDEGMPWFIQLWLGAHISNLVFGRDTRDLEKGGLLLSLQLILWMVAKCAPKRLRNPGMSRSPNVKNSNKPWFFRMASAWREMGVAQNETGGGANRRFWSMFPPGQPILDFRNFLSHGERCLGPSTKKLRQHLGLPGPERSPEAEGCPDPLGGREDRETVARQKMLNSSSMEFHPILCHFVPFLCHVVAILCHLVPSCAILCHFWRAIFQDLFGEPYF